MQLREIAREAGRLLNVSSRSYLSCNHSSSIHCIDASMHPHVSCTHLRVGHSSPFLSTIPFISFLPIDPLIYHVVIISSTFPSSLFLFSLNLFISYPFPHPIRSLFKEGEPFAVGRKAKLIFIGLPLSSFLSSQLQIRIAGVIMTLLRTVWQHLHV